MKNNEFRVQNNRLLFICPSCRKRTIYPVLDVQRSSYKCQRCGISTRIAYNRTPVALKTNQGKEIQVTLQEISPRGAIFQVLHEKDADYLKIGQEVYLICSRNKDFVPEARCIIQSNGEGWVGLNKTE